MHSLESLRELRSLNFFLYGGLSEEEFYSRNRPNLKPVEGEVTAYATFNLRTKEITVNECAQSKSKD